MSQTYTNSNIPLDDDTQLVLSLINRPTSTGNILLPGASAASAAMLVEKLKHNYLHNDAYFQGTIFHNHSMDHILAVYALGGSPEAIAEVYKSHDYTEPAHPSPEPITDKNFFSHLGDVKFYNAYLIYFCKILATTSAGEAIHRFIFSPAYNYNANLAADAPQPVMLDRFLSGVLHPLIHLGHGAEFGIVQQLAEGLANAAIHEPYHGDTLPHELFTSSDPYARGLSGSLGSTKTERPPFLSLLNDMLKDERLAPEALKVPFQDEPGGISLFAALKAGGGRVITEIVNRWYDAWTIGSSEEELEDRLEGMVEDVILTSTAIFGLAGVAAKGERVFNAGFLTMHFVTSSNFIPTLVLRANRTRSQTMQSPLPLASRLLLIRGYMSAIFLWLLAHPRPNASSITNAIPTLYAATDELLSPPTPKHAYAPGDAPKRGFFSNNGVRTMPFGARAWPQLFANAAIHPNEHLPKIIRALGAADVWYGQRAQGTYAGALDGAEKLDGTLFLRVALLTMERLGWAMEETPKAQWDRDGYWSIASTDVSNSNE